MRRLLAIVALATLAACDSFDPLVDNSVTGTWRGSAGGQTFVVAMSQAQTVVAGSGTMTPTAGGASQTLSVSGTFTQPTFSGTFTPNGGQAISLVATVENDVMVGTLTGGGFNGTGIGLRRDQ